MGNTFASTLAESAPTSQPRPNVDHVKGAMRVLREAAQGSSYTAKARLQEALTTDDFPYLLGTGFEVEARAAFRNVVDETAALTQLQTLPDFEPRRLRDVYGNSVFKDVSETEEYKSAHPWQYTDRELQLIKTGLQYGLSWELMLSGNFSDIINFPAALGRDGANTRNHKVYEVFFGADGELNEEVFGTVSDVPLTYANLLEVVTALYQVEDERGEGAADTSSLVLIVPPSQRMAAEAIVNAGAVRETFGAGTRTTREVERANPLGGLTVQVSAKWAELNGTNRGTAWAVVPAGSTANPAVIQGQLAGHEAIDIRVKRDQGERVGGGAVPYTEGSFENDTIWFRGRYVIGTTAGYTAPTFASTGTASDEG